MNHAEGDVELRNHAVKPIQKMAFAGIGNPVKYEFSSAEVLKRARRNAPAGAIIKAVHGNHCSVLTSCNVEKRIIAGATPKLTRSHKESSSLPSGEYAFRARAAKPSQKSAMAAKAMNIYAH